MTTRRANRLASETSPYLLQHAHNPVDWYPWGPEAIDRAKADDKPILLSIGYAACHWCHVMERESFEDEDTAALMNEHFVSIKVDREERPDLDAIYMDAAQAMTGSGGWPLTAFLTPGRPAVLRRHVLPAGAAARPAVVPPGADGHRAGVDRAARRGRDAGDEDRRAHRAGRVAERLARTADGRDHPDGVLASAPGVRRRARRLRRRAEVPAADDARVRPAMRGARLGARGDDRHDHARSHGRRRDLRPPRRRVRALLDGRVVARAALREDALRQRAARAAVHAGVAGDAGRPLPARGDRDARVPAPRDAARRGRVLLVAGRGQRGRRGEVLRVVVGRARDARRAGRCRVLRRDARGQLGRDERAVASARHGRRRGGARVVRRRAHAPRWRTLGRCCSRSASGA